MSDPVFVTGGSGFVGGALVDRLVADGHPVRALARSDAAAASVEARGAVAVRGDLGDVAALGAGMEGSQLVFHVAGVNAMCVPDPRPMYRDNVEGADRVVIAAHEAGVRRLVHTSSAATIGEARGTIGREDSPHRGSQLSHYERSKALGERRVMARARELGLDVVCLNPSSVQGPGRTTGTARLLLDVAKGRLPLAVDTWVSVVDIDDCVEGLLAGAERGAAGERYLLSGTSITLREAIEVASRILPLPRPVHFVPGTAATVAGALGDLVRTIGRRSVPICGEAARTLLHGHRYDGSRAERDLGVRYTPFEATLRRTLAWYAAQGLIPPLPGPPPSPEPT
ncbi:MAG: NAD-dependent epimerase/dehydratase family protein [Actinomycetota bacterium]